jgi:hypothetical protein
LLVGNNILAAIVLFLLNYYLTSSVRNNAIAAIKVYDGAFSDKRSFEKEERVLPK